MFKSAHADNFNTKAFRSAAKRAGIPGLRWHDLRHTFAVRTLLNWYRNSKEPAREMIKNPQNERTQAFLRAIL